MMERINVAAALLTMPAATRRLVIAVVLVWLALLVFLVTIASLRLRRSRAVIRAALERAGYETLQMQYRHLRLGPFSLWDTSRSQDVHRILVRDRSSGATLIVWARFGRSWFTRPEKLEFRCEDRGAEARLQSV